MFKSISNYLLKSIEDAIRALRNKIIITLIIAAAIYVYQQKYLPIASDYLNELATNFIGIITLICIGFFFGILYFLYKIYTKISDLLEEELPIVISDTQTQFESASISGIVPNTLSKETIKHPHWHEKDIRYSKELRNSKWIAHTDFSNPSEVVGSGTFVFFKEFEIPQNIKEFRTCDLFFLVDDKCSIIINGKKLADNISGEKEMHYFYIKDYIKTGKNEIRFHVNNQKSDTSIKVAAKTANEGKISDLVIIQKQEMSNWYGIRFCIRITCIRG